MKTVYPDYYKDFKCIAEKCKHSCCIGWEIDIDDKSLGFYKSVKGDFGGRLLENISFEGTPHFILSENERCPFLNQKNLCDIYTNLGEDKLCQICSDHPRFYNRLEDGTEAGLGLCCEEAARLIITKKEPVKLIGEEENPKGLILLRKKVLEALQQRELTIPRRFENVCNLLEASEPHFNIPKWVKIFESLERLDESWTGLLSKLRKDYETADTSGFAEYMRPRESEYEQFICYLIYRHALKAEFLEDFLLYIFFAMLSYEIIYAVGAVIFTEKGCFSLSRQLDIIRLFSSEIEYSDKNLDIILENLETEIFSC